MALLVPVRTAAVAMVVLTAIVSVAHTGLVYVGARLLFPAQAAGSLIVRDGRPVGSRLIAQNFSAPDYFHPRPSAGDRDDGAPPGASALAPSDDELVDGGRDFAGVRALADAYRVTNGLPAGAPVPVDAVTRSASGVDPHISVADAALQTPRVARARGMTEDAVRALVDAETRGRDLGIFGEPRVNVLMLNLALDDAAASAPPARRP